MSYNIGGIKARVGLVGVVSRSVKLVQKGAEHSGLCPFHKEKTPSFTVNEEKGFYHCFGCGAHGSVIDFVMHTEGLNLAEAIASLAETAGLDARPAAMSQKKPAEPLQPSSSPVDFDRQDVALKIFRHAVPGAGFVRAYLAGRGLAMDEAGDLPASIRGAPMLKHGPSGLAFPAMVAGVQNHDGGVVAVHRTYLDLPDIDHTGAGELTMVRADLLSLGTGKQVVKAAISPNKMMLGAVRGCAVRLAVAGKMLAIAEGIETALSILQARPSWTVWAALSVGNIKNQPIPPWARRVIICADGNKPGSGAWNQTEAAAKELAERALDQDMALGRVGRARTKVEIRRPPIGKDWNDLLKSREAA